MAIERGEPFLERYGGRISSEWYFPKLIEVWLEDREIYDACAGVHRGDGLDHLAPDGRRGPPERHRRLQGDVVAGRGPAARPSTSRRPTRASRARGEARHGVRARSGRAPGTLTAERGRAGRADRRRWPSRSATSTPGCRCRAPVSTSPATFVTVIGTSTCSMIVSPDEVAAARDHRASSGTASCPASTATRLDRPRSATCSPGSCARWTVTATRTPGSRARRLGDRPRRDRPRRARLVQRQPLDPRRRRPERRDLRPHPAELTRARSTARCSSRSPSATAGSSTTSRSTASSCRRSSPVGGIAERSPLTMQLHRGHERAGACTSPTWREIPARGAALFGAVAAGVYDDIDARDRGHAPVELAHLHARSGGQGGLRPGLRDLPHACTRSLGRTEVELLHGLKRIRTETRRDPWSDGELDELRERGAGGQPGAARAAGWSS